MSTWQEARRVMLIQSYRRAQEEGHVGRWIVTHLLSYLLMMVFKCLFVFPLRLIWHLTDRNRNDPPVIHFLKFAGVTVVVYGILVMLLLQALGISR